MDAPATASVGRPLSSVDARESRGTASTGDEVRLDTVLLMGLRIEVADEPDSMAAARAIFDQVWPGEGTQVTSNLLRALLHAGGYCSVVIDDEGDRVVGAALGFPARDPSLPGGVFLHSVVRVRRHGRQTKNKPASPVAAALGFGQVAKV